MDEVLFNFSFKFDDVKLILDALQKFPYEKSVGPINNILNSYNQQMAQIQEAEKKKAQEKKPESQTAPELKPEN